MKKAIYPGSFDPLTKGHEDIIMRAGDKFDNLIIGVGQNPNKIYTFSFPERVRMIEGVVRKMVNSNLLDSEVEVIPYSGLLVDFAFEKGSNTVVRGIRGIKDFEEEELLHFVGQSQKLCIDTMFMFTQQNLSHVSSRNAKGLLGFQGRIEDYVSINVKHFLEARMMGQYFVGLTGTIGAGKSYITDKFIELGKEFDVEVYNIDLDKIGHWILEEGSDDGYKKVRQKLITEFGDSIRKEGGYINRKSLGEIVFNDPKKRKKLDKILYGSIIVGIRKQLLGKKGIIILNGALLAESNITGLTNNNIVLVGVEADIQKTRLEGRGLNGEQIETRINSQFSTEAKRNVIRDRIETDGHGEVTDISNNGDNETDIRRAFWDMIKSVDVFGELRIRSALATIGHREKWMEMFGQIKILRDTAVRNYHNWGHIVDCINKLYQIKDSLSQEDFINLLLALLFHDAIYDITSRSGENEQKSAILAGKILTEMGINNVDIPRIQHLINLTAKHEVNPEDILGKYIVDIDLSILGEKWEIYKSYSRAIRLEYSIYGETHYRQGRIQFLEGMLKKPQIFQTPYFHSKYENQARTNIKNELAILNS